MQHIIKLSTALATAGVSMAFLATAAFAADTQVVNTGNNVDVNAGTSNTTNVGVSNSNTAVISQSSTSNVNTGGNTANRNIGATSIKTGNAGVSNVMGASANSNATSISGVGGGSSNDTTLTNTGDDVLLFGNGGNTTNVGVNNTNTAVVSQSATSNVNTGDNKANRNIGPVNVTSGNAGVSNVFGVQVNGNQTAINGVGNNHQGNSLDVTNTGDDVNVGCMGGLESVLLDVYDQCGNVTNIGVTNVNEALISQSSDSDVNTGGNKANRNISGAGILGAGSDASIMSGTANVGNAFTATANGNATTINGNGLFDGSSNDVTVTNTGDDFNLNGAGNNVTTNVSVSNSNTAVVAQYSSNNVNTGDNKANRNIDLDGTGTMIDSGNAALLNAFMVMANWNGTMIGGNAGTMGMFTWWN